MSSFATNRAERSRVPAGALASVFLAVGLGVSAAQVAKPLPHNNRVMRPSNAAPAREAKAQPQSQPQPQNVAVPAEVSGGNVNRQMPRQQARADAQQHLGAWMSSHENLTLQQKQSALDAEPGFHNLRPQEQQRLHELVTRLHSMPPEQRERLIQRTEAMERLAPAQRQQVRSATGELGMLPADRQRAVVRVFRSAIDLPEGQRQGFVNSPQVRGQLNDSERETLNHLIAIQPAAAQAGFPEFNSHQAAATNPPR